MSDLVSLLLIMLIAVILIAFLMSLRSRFKRIRKSPSVYGALLSLLITILSLVAVWTIALGLP